MTQPAKWRSRRVAFHARSRSIGPLIAYRVITRPATASTSQFAKSKAIKA